MTQEPKLLTEAEARTLYHLPWAELVTQLRERGLIAPAPKPVPLVEAELAKVMAESVFMDDRNRVPYGNGFREGFNRAQELAPAATPLTREMVREAVRRYCPIEGPWTPNQITAVFEKLTQVQP